MYWWDIIPHIFEIPVIVLPVIISTIIGVYYGVNKKNTINTSISGIMYGIGFLISSVIVSSALVILLYMR